MSNEELSARYRAIETGLARGAFRITTLRGSGLIFEWAGYPLLVIDVDML